jgi:hypothetical protein
MDIITKPNGEVTVDCHVTEDLTEREKMAFALMAGQILGIDLSEKLN